MLFKKHLSKLFLVLGLVFLVATFLLYKQHPGGYIVSEGLRFLSTTLCLTSFFLFFIRKLFYTTTKNPA